MTINRTVSSSINKSIN